MFRYKSFGTLMFEGSDMALRNGDEVEITFRISTPSFLFIRISTQDKSVDIPIEPEMFNRLFKKVFERRHKEKNRRNWL